jgi:tetratricopeptide (TPR) repeat protein
MLKRILAVFLLFNSIELKAQKVNTDSLWRVAETTTNDSIRLNTITRIHIHYINLSYDSNFIYNDRIIAFCKKQNNDRYTALGIVFTSYIYYRIGDNYKVQQHILAASKIAEKNNDQAVLGRIENMKSLIEVDAIKRIGHLKKTLLYAKELSETSPARTIIFGNLSGAFLTANQVDSAFFYAQKMFELSIKSNDTLSSYVMAVMGNVYLKMKQPDIAYAFYKKGIRGASITNKIGDLVRAYAALARYFEETKQIDSALYYWKKPFEYGPKEAFASKLGSSKKLYEFYYAKGNNDSAAKYMNYFIIANDSINNANKVAQLQTAKLEDELRQLELQKEKLNQDENRKHNIQLAITAIGVLIILILFLLLSRTILVSHKLVAFLNVIILLVVFEFINLLIHPWLEEITHHSPALMLLGLVALAAILVPLHHRLEHWTSKVLVEKNKAIRLSKAKKIVEELESQ